MVTVGVIPNGTTPEDIWSQDPAAVLRRVSMRLDTAQTSIAKLDSYYAGTQPLSFLSQAAVDALGNTLRTVAVNLPRLAVDSLAERLNVVGFRIDGQPDDDLWSAWRSCDMQDAATQCHTEALAVGRSFAIVWARAGQPLISVESPRQVQVERDPATRAVTAAVKRWAEYGKARAVVYGPEVITRFTSDAAIPQQWPADPVDQQGFGFPPDSWTVSGETANPLGAVPVVPFINRGRLLDLEGVSEMAPILDLADALNKVMSDSLVSSEFYSRPRRWVTGLEIVEDEDGNPVDPFSSEASRVWQSEAPETRFGSFDGGSLDSYGTLVGIITQQIGALAGLPPHYLGVHQDQPASADAIRSSESSLVTRALGKQRSFGSSWAQVAALAVAARDGADPSQVRAETMWQSSETRTPAQAADAASKLVAAGIIPTGRAQQDLGYTPDEIEEMRSMERGAALDRAAVNIAPQTEPQP